MAQAQLETVEVSSLIGKADENSEARQSTVSEETALSLMHNLRHPLWLVKERERAKLILKPERTAELDELGFWQDLAVDRRELEGSLALRDQYSATGAEIYLKLLELDLGLRRIASEDPDLVALHSRRMGAKLGLADLLCSTGNTLFNRAYDKAVEHHLLELCKGDDIEAMHSARDVLLLLAAKDSERLSRSTYLELMNKQLPQAARAELGFEAIYEYSTANSHQTGIPFRPTVGSDDINGCGYRKEHLCQTREEVSQIVGKAKNVLFIHNINEALGDEWIRNGYLVHSLLASSPEREVTILTAKPFLYNHPRVRTIDIRDTELVRRELAGEDFEVIFKQEYILDSISDEVGQVTAQVEEDAKCVFRSPLGSNYFSSEYESVVLGESREIPLDSHVSGLSNPYDYPLRLISWLNLENPWPLDIGPSLLTSTMDPEAMGWWNEQITTNPSANGREVVFLNPFGGTYESKGFTGEQNHDLASFVEKLVESNGYVLLVPNGKPWGSSERCREVRNLLPDHLQEFVNVEVPTPAEHSTLQIHLMGWVDRYIGTEGGASHLALASCAKSTVLLFASSGFINWLPLLRGPDQHVVWGENIFRKRSESC